MNSIHVKIDSIHCHFVHKRLHAGFFVLLLFKENLWSSQISAINLHTYTHTHSHTMDKVHHRLHMVWERIVGRWYLIVSEHVKRFSIMNDLVYVILYFYDDQFICYFWVLVTKFYTRDSFWDDIEFKLHYCDHIECNEMDGFLIEFSLFLFSPPRQFIESLKSSTTQCWPRPVSIITVATILNWAQHAENTSVSAHFQSPIQEIRISFVHCQKLK